MSAESEEHKDVEVDLIWSHADFLRRKHTFADLGGPGWRMNGHWNNTGGRSVVGFVKIPGFSMTIDSIFDNKMDSSSKTEIMIPEKLVGAKSSAKKHFSKTSKKRKIMDMKPSLGSHKHLHNSKSKINMHSFDTDVYTSINKIGTKELFQNGHNFHINKSDIDINSNNSYSSIRLIKKGGFASVYLLVKDPVSEVYQKSFELNDKS